MSKSAEPQQEKLRIPDDKTIELYSNQARKLHDALVSKSANQTAIVEIIIRHNWIQRLGILSAYSQLFPGKDDIFENLVEKKLSKDFYILIKNCFRDRYELWADLILDALSEKKHDMQKIISYLILQNDDDTARINAVLPKPLHEIIEEKLTPNEKQQKYFILLKQLIQSSNQRNYRADEAVDAIIEAAKGFGCNEEVFVKVMTSSSYYNFRKIEEKLLETTQKPFVGYVDAEFSIKQTSKETHLAYYALAQFMLDPPSALAYLLKQSKNNAVDINLSVLFADYMRDELIEKYKKFGDFHKDTKSQFSGNARNIISWLWGVSPE